MSDKRTLVIIPTYNERENVAEIAAAAQAALEGVEILFVDDGSPDGTGDLLDAMVQANPAVHVIHRPGKLGLGTAYIEGFRWALERHFDFVIEMDADFSHNPSYLPELLRRAEAGADVVVGSRYVKGGGTVNWGLGRRLISRSGGLYARTVLGLKIRDMTAGFVCYRADALRQLDLDGIRSNGYGFQVEMKYRAVRAGLRVEEVPIVFHDRRVGQSKMTRAIFAEAMVMVWKLRLGR